MIWETKLTVAPKSAVRKNVKKLFPFTSLILGSLLFTLITLVQDILVI
jgi:hypothetical protein